MSYNDLNDEEKQEFKVMLEDLHTIFDFEEIPAEDIPDIISKLKSNEVKAYIEGLSQGSKPESALREAFFAGRSLLSKYFGGTATPEVNMGQGFVDYILTVDGRSILIELKSLFETVFESGKVRRLKRLTQKELKPDKFKEQVLKYLQEGSEYIILTDLRNWYFFNKQTTAANFKYFHSTDFFDLVEEYGVVGDFWDFLRRKDFQSIREELDKKFFESLKIWVDKLSEVKFDLDDQTKIEHIIHLLNKFIFIQTLDDFFVIDARWIKTNWDEKERKWKAKGKYQVLKQYFDEIDNWFYEYYDTELFRGNILEYVKKDDNNIEKLYNNLQMVLGVTGWQTTFRGIAGVMQYNFRFIDEDIFGKAYETFLAGVRHDEGIYYTPKYITEYIVDTTVGKIFEETLTQIREALEAEDFERSQLLLDHFVSIRVLDPACGSGSFLIKAVRKIMEKYKVLKDLLNDLNAKYNTYNGSLVRPKDVEEKVHHIQTMVDTIKANDERDLISRLLVRHIHGNDLDRKALEVAKVNIWLEAIKLSPQQFRFDKLPSDTNHILPDLEMNLVNGNSVVGLPDQNVIDYMKSEHADKLLEITKMRSQYLENPTHPELIEKIGEIKESIREGLDEKFIEHVDQIEISKEIKNATKPLYWPLEFWYLYFSGKEPLKDQARGADIIVGNPPYERIQVLNSKSPVTVDFLSKAGFKASTGNYDLAVIFIEKGFKLLKENGEFGYIVTNKFITGDYGEGLRNYLSENKAITQIIDFGDQQVFEDATTYTALLFLKRKENQEFRYAHVKKLQRNIEQLVKIREMKDLDDVEQVSSTLKSTVLNSKPWVFTIGVEDKIFSKLGSYKTLSDIADRIFQGLVTGADPVFILELVEDLNGLTKVYSRARKREYTLERALLRPLLKGKEIKRWFVGNYNQVIIYPYILVDERASLIERSEFERKYPRTWRYLNDNKDLLEGREGGKWKVPNWYAYGRRQNLEQFDQQKIMTQVLASRASFALDHENNFYFVGGGNAGGYGVVLKPELDVSLNQISALLNSVLLDWYLKKISTRFRGGFYSYARRFIERLPIKLPETENEKALFNRLEKIVSRILEFKEKRYGIQKIWIDVSYRLSNSNRTLMQIIKDDEEKIKSGDFDNVWTNSVSFYPNSNNEQMDMEFGDFSIDADTEKLSLNINGLTDEGKEVQIYNMIFKNNELMSQVYNCLDGILDSRLRIKTLRQLLEKTVIPIIRPNIAKSTVNIIKKTSVEYGDGYVSICTIDNEIVNLEAQIDAIVFDLYGLNRKEIDTVMRNLDLVSSYEQLVLKHLQ